MTNDKKPTLRSIDTPEFGVNQKTVDEVLSFIKKRLTSFNDQEIKSFTFQVVAERTHCSAVLPEAKGHNALEIIGALHDHANDILNPCESPLARLLRE